MTVCYSCDVSCLNLFYLLPDCFYYPQRHLLLIAATDWTCHGASIRVWREVGRLTYYDNMSTINVSKNPVNHSRNKHIDIRHHFLRDHVSKETITLDFVNSESQIIDIFTKLVCEATFINLRRNSGICALKDL